MTTTTRKNASRSEVRQSIREFSKLMSPAPKPTQAPKLNPAVFAIDAESAKLFALVANA